MTPIERYQQLRDRLAELDQMTAGKPDELELTASAVAGVEVWYFGDGKGQGRGYRLLYPGDPALRPQFATTKIRHEAAIERAELATICPKSR